MHYAFNLFFFVDFIHIFAFAQRCFHCSIFTLCTFDLLLVCVILFSIPHTQAPAVPLASTYEIPVSSEDHPATNPGENFFRTEEVRDDGGKTSHGAFLPACGERSLLTVSTRLAKRAISFHNLTCRKSWSCHLYLDRCIIVIVKVLAKINEYNVFVQIYNKYSNPSSSQCICHKPAEYVSNVRSFWTFLE